MRQKKIVDYRLEYLNDWIEIKIYFFYDPRHILQLSELVWTLYVLQ